MTITITIDVRPLLPPHLALHFKSCKANAKTDLGSAFQYRVEEQNSI